MADVGGDVEEERKPAYPCKELDFADTLDLVWQLVDGTEETFEEGQHSASCFGRSGVEGWIAFSAGSDADAHGEGHDEGCDGTEDFELRVTEPRQVLWELDVAEEIASDVSDTGRSHQPGVGRLLLVSWSNINNIGSDTGLDCESVSKARVS